MKCPRCGLIVTDRVPKCPGCGFSIADLDRRLRRVPRRVGYVNDFAGLLSVEQKTHLEARLFEYQRDLDGELVLVTTSSTKPVKPSEYVFWLFNRWAVGGETHAGLLILLTTHERRIESEVGYGWEHILSDVGSGKVLDEVVLPLLQEHKIYEALCQGVEQLAGIIEQARPTKQKEVEETSVRDGESP